MFQTRRMYLRVRIPLKKCGNLALSVWISYYEDVLKIHPHRVQLACGTMWLEMTANHWSPLWRTASQPKGAKLTYLVEQKLSHTHTPSEIHPPKFQNIISNIGRAI